MLDFYLVSFLAGVGLSVVSFLSGLHHVSVFDHVFGHHHHVHIGRRSASPLNAATITAFLAWFGGGGLVLHQLTAWPEMAVAGASLGSGIAGGTLVARFLDVILAREKPLEATTMIGAIAKVTSRIREGGTGEIVFVINGTRKVSAARSESGTEIEKGAEVVVVRLDKGIAYVSTWDELAATTSVA